MKYKDIENLKIRFIYEDEKYIEKNNFSAQSIYIEFENGIIITESNDDFPIGQVDKKRTFKKYRDSHLCIGQHVIDILSSELLPSHSYLLSNNKILYGDSPGPNYFGWFLSDYDEKIKSYYEFLSVKDKL